MKSLLTIIVLAALLGGIIYLKNAGSTVDKNKLKTDLLPKTLQKLVAPGTKYAIDDIKEANGLYEITLTLGEGTNAKKLTSYISKDGKIFFTSGIKLDELEKPANNTTAQPQTQAPTVNLNTIKDIFNNKNVIKFGDTKRKLFLVEISDPSCPYCQAAAGKNPELNKQMGSQFILVSDGGAYVSPVQEMRKLTESGQASFAYVYQNGHGNGEMAMKSLFCANDQNKFWEAHDKLMTKDGYSLINNDVKNDKASSGKLSDFLASVVSIGELKSCLDSGKYDSYLSTNQQLAGSLGVNGTPGFFINTTKFAGANNWTDMKSAADAALK